MFNVTNEREVMIFRKDFEEGKPTYSIGLSRKNAEGKYENGYMQCQFRKGVELKNQTKIKVKSAWLSFYNTKEKKTMPFVFINDFDVAGEAKEEDLPF